MPLVPSEVGIAVTTRRTAFVSILKKQVEEGREIPRDQIQGLLDLCIEFIEGTAADQKRIQMLENTVKELEKISKGIDKLTGEMRKTLRDIQKQVPLGEDE